MRNIYNGGMKNLAVSRSLTAVMGGGRGGARSARVAEGTRRVRTRFEIFRFWDKTRGGAE